MLQFIEIPKCALTLSTTLNASIVRRKGDGVIDWVSVYRDPVDRFWSACKTNFAGLESWQDKLRSGIDHIAGGGRVNWYFQPQTFFYEIEQIRYFVPFRELCADLPELFVGEKTIRNFDLQYWLGSMLNDSDHSDDHAALTYIVEDAAMEGTIRRFYADDYSMIQYALNGLRN